MAANSKYSEADKALYDNLLSKVSAEAEKKCVSVDDCDDEDFSSSSQSGSKELRNTGLVNAVVRRILPLLTFAIVEGIKQSKVEIEEIKMQIKNEVKDEIKSEIVPVLKDELKYEVKSEVTDEIKTEVMTDTKMFVANSLTKVSNQMTLNNVKYITGQDKREAYDRKLNITFSGIPLQQEERRNPDVTTNIVVDELNSITGLTIKKEDISSCYRIFRRPAANGNTDNNGPPIIVARFISHQIRNKVLSYRTMFNTSGTPGTPGTKFINEDMTFLQQKLFKYLRTREDIIIKKTISYKDGRIIFLIKDNETEKKWSRVDSVLDLATVDPRFEVDLNASDMLFTLGMKDCKVNITSE